MSPTRRGRLPLTQAAPAAALLRCRAMPVRRCPPILLPIPRCPPVAALQGLVVGGCICYDMNFPEVARDLAFKGAELMVRIQGYM